MASRFIALVFLAGFGATVQAQQFSPPDEVVFSGKTYKLAYKRVSPDGRAIFEYTTDNESVENWSSLVTLNYFKSSVATPLKWAEIQKLSLDRERPKPSYSLYLKGDAVYSRIIYEPDARNASYESNVHKSFHASACGGVVVYQFAQKYRPSADQTSEGKSSKLKQISDENSRFTDELEKSDWLPDCG